VSTYLRFVVCFFVLLSVHARASTREPVKLWDFTAQTRGYGTLVKIDQRGDVLCVLYAHTAWGTLHGQPVTEPANYLCKFGRDRRVLWVKKIQAPEPAFTLELFKDEIAVSVPVGSSQQRLFQFKRDGTLLRSDLIKGSTFDYDASGNVWVLSRSALNPDHRVEGTQIARYDRGNFEAIQQPQLLVETTNTLGVPTLHVWHDQVFTHTAAWNSAAVHQSPGSVKEYGGGILLTRHKIGGPLLSSVYFDQVGVYPTFIPIAITPHGSIRVAIPFDTLLTTDTGLRIEGKGGPDAAVLAFDLNGSLLWSHVIAGAAHDEIRAVETDAFGNCYVVGFTLGGLFPPIMAPTNSAFAAKFSPKGTNIWIYSYADSVGNGVAVSEDGAVALTGFTQGFLNPFAISVRQPSGRMGLAIDFVSTALVADVETPGRYFIESSPDLRAWGREHGFIPHSETTLLPLSMDERKRFYRIRAE